MKCKARSYCDFTTSNLVLQPSGTPLPADMVQ